MLSFEAPVFTMRGKKAAVTFKATGNDTLVGVIGSADLQLDRKHMEHRPAGDIGPAWLKLSLDLDQMPARGHAIKVLEEQMEFVGIYGQQINRWRAENPPRRGSANWIAWTLRTKSYAKSPRLCSTWSASCEKA
jgi:hypothetical protein